MPVEIWQALEVDRRVLKVLEELVEVKRKIAREHCTSLKGR